MLWGRHVAAVARALPDGQPAFALLPDIRAARGLGINHAVHMVPPAKWAFERVLSGLPRSREELRWRVDMAAARLEPGQQLWLAGHQREGIKGAAKVLQQRFGEVSVARTKRHTRVLVAVRDDRPGQLPDIDDTELSFEGRFGRHEVACRSVPGTFAHGRVDDGTRRLLDYLATDRERTRHVLDLGAGCGVIGTSLLLAKPSRRVTMIDASWAATESCRRTLAANGVGDSESVSVVLADVASAPANHVDLVVTNPPFHDGREQNRQLVARFAAAAAARLARGGRFVLVANRHLAYRDDLEARFRHVKTAWEDSRFRIWFCAGAIAKGGA